MTNDERETIRREAREAALLEVVDKLEEWGCVTVAQAVRGEFDTPTPAEPAGEALLPCPFCGGMARRVTITDEAEAANIGGDVITCIDCDACTRVFFGEKEGIREAWNRRAALAPQPDADEREAMVYLIECTLQEHPAQHESAWHRAHYVADALLAAGWTRKREEG